MPAPKPPPPENLVGALQDPVHINKGRLLGTQPIRTGRKTMPEPKLTDADISDACRFLSVVEALVEGNEGSPSRILARYLDRALAELEALRTERDTLRHTIEMLQLQVGPTDWGSNRPQRAERAASTGQAVPGILRQREPPRPQRRKRG